MKRLRFQRMVAVLTIVLLASVARADVIVDGRTGDWWGTPPVQVDGLGDGGADGVDFDSLYATTEYGWLILRFQVGDELLLQDMNDITLLIDTDHDPATGLASHGIGAELRWRFGERSGTWFGPGGPFPLEHADLHLTTTPTVSATQFEIAFSLDAQKNGTPLLPTGTISLALLDEAAGGDSQPDAGGVDLVIPEGPWGSPEPGTMDRATDASLRFVSWNVLFDGFTERPEPFRRILQAIEPDVILFVEMWDTQPGQVTDLLDQWLPVEGGWHAAKQGGDAILASQFPISECHATPGARATAFLVNITSGPLAGPFLVIGAHPPCCNNNEDRQREIDAFMAYLRDAEQGTGEMALAENTPIVIAGDMNLVGWSEQLATLRDGAIVNTTDYGPAFSPDWDGTPLKDLFPRNLTLNQVYTWRDDGSGFNPGKLDYAVISDAVLRAARGFVLDTRTLPVSTLTQHGLQYEDSESASDHLPVVVDLLPAVSSRAEERALAPESPAISIDAAPNPFNASVRLQIDLAHAGSGNVDVFDLLGRRVAHLQDGGWRAGRHELVWDGRNAAGNEVGSGLYFVRFEGENLHRIRRLVLLR